VKPDWLKIKPPESGTFSDIKKIITALNLHTVCQEAHCPNMSECWSKGNYTFIIMGDVCTRACKFCAVKTGYPKKLLDKGEPEKLVKAIKQTDLSYITLTSVDRDDIDDGGASHFAACIRKIKEECNVMVEALIPDFRGDKNALKTVVDSKPDVIAHNIETVERLQKIRDPRAGYLQSLKVLENIKKLDRHIYTKSSIMLGLGETKEEVICAMKDLIKRGVDIFTLGQYLKPKNKSLEVKEYITPEMFKFYEATGRSLGFSYTLSGPFVRSSYLAAEAFMRKEVRNAV
jgi:lipoyl synthase